MAEHGSDPFDVLSASWLKRMEAIPDSPTVVRLTLRAEFLVEWPRRRGRGWGLIYPQDDERG